MENINMSQFLTGLSAASIAMGLALFGLTLGNSIASGIVMGEHLLFWPATICMGAGVLNLLLIVLSDSSQPRNESA